jgi:hypothetical protein
MRTSPPAFKYRALQERLLERARTAAGEQREFFIAMAESGTDVIAQIEKSSNLIAESRALLAEADTILHRAPRHP